LQTPFWCSMYQAMEQTLSASLDPPLHLLMRFAILAYTRFEPDRALGNVLLRRRGYGMKEIGTELNRLILVKPGSMSTQKRLISAANGAVAIKLWLDPVIGPVGRDGCSTFGGPAVRSAKRSE